jgi:hypothetical protein
MAPGVLFENLDREEDVPIPTTVMLEFVHLYERPTPPS